MSPLGRSLLLPMIAFSFSVPALAQPKADAGSGPTKGATSNNHAGSGPTTGAKPNSDTAAASNSGSTENSAGVTPGPKSTGGSQPVTPAILEKKQ